MGAVGSVAALVLRQHACAHLHVLQSDERELAVVTPTVPEEGRDMSEPQPVRPKREPWKPGDYCDSCANTGEIDCHCGGDLCVCGAQEITCPRCDGRAGDGSYYDEHEDDQP